MADGEAHGNAMLDAGALIASYGYWALAIGCFLEGETLLALAGFAAHLGHLDLAWVIVIATVAASAGDQCCFWLGRRHGEQILARFPSLATKSTRIRTLALRFDAWFIVGLRFAYGLRLAGPLLLGTTTIRTSRFVAYNVLGAFVWSLVVASLGWFFGHLVETLLGKVQRFEGVAVLTIVVASALVWWLRRRRQQSYIDGQGPGL